MPDILLLNADAGHIPLADGSCHVCVTSPPYYGLRKYAIDGGAEIGMEETPELYLARMVAVFQEVRRVLRPDGVIFVNMGDSYANNPGNGRGGETPDGGIPHRSGTDKTHAGYKPLDLMNIPARLVLALQADGWYHRSTIIWSKPNPMPESVNGWRWERCRVKVNEGKIPARNIGLQTGDGHSWKPAGTDNYNMTATWSDCPGCPKCDPNGGLVLRRGAWRPTTAHEYIFMLTKTDTYFCDQEAVREANVREWGENNIGPNNRINTGILEGAVLRRDKDPHCGLAHTMPNPAGRNARSVWTFATQAYSGAHFATFPKELPRRCLKASTSERGCCPECGAPWARVVEKSGGRGQSWHNHQNDIVDGQSKARLNGNPNTQTLGFRPTCECWRAMPDPDAPRTRNSRKLWQQDTGNYWKWRAVGYAGETKPMIVADIFCGSGTTGLVARELGHHFVGLDLSLPYLSDQARERLGLRQLADYAAGRGRNGSGSLAGLPMFEEAIQNACQNS